MIDSVSVLWAMGYHYLSTIGKRKQYTVYERDLSPEEKRENRDALFSELRVLCNNMFKAAKTDIHIEGEENLPEKGPVVYMSNHRGIFDTPLIALVVKEPVVFIGKKELKSAPIIGKWFDVHGDIYIDREDMRSAVAAIVEGVKELKQGQSMVIFPEGTRSKDGTVGEFKAGSFKLATKANVPIIPIAIKNTEQILEDKGRIQRASIKMCIGKAIDVPNLSEEEKKKLHTTTEECIRKMVEAM